PPRAGRGRRPVRHAQDAPRRVPGEAGPERGRPAPHRGAERRRWRSALVRYRLVAVGALKRGPLAAAAERYARLLRGLAQLEVFEVKDRSALGPEGARSRHAVDSLRHADGHLLLLDERGEQLSTAQLAARGAELERAATRPATLVIGGPDRPLLLLDERGEQLSTAQLAGRAAELERAGTSRVTLFIGGPDGHGPELRAAAHGSLALSRLTLPHDLARVVLLEQLYRVEAL